jgi:RNA polymerase sigma-70 factor, ECF subfamily
LRSRDPDPSSPREPPAATADPTGGGRSRRITAEVPEAKPLDIGEIYRQHAGEVSRWARRLLGPGQEAEDVLHEVFLVVHRRLPEWRAEAQLTTWLYAITVRVVQDHRRRQRWLPWHRLRRWLEPDAPAPPTPLQALETRRSVELTYQLLDQLPEHERSALILFELEGMTGDQIAAVTGDAVGTIWVRLHRARARFRRAFERRDEQTAGAVAATEEEDP